MTAQIVSDRSLGIRLPMPPNMAVRALTALAFIGSALFTGSAAQGSVIIGPVVNPTNGHSYYLLSLNNWTASQGEAVTLGGNLVTINDAAENAWVYSTFATYGGVDRNLWTGLYDTDQQVNSANRAQRRLEFAWISGEPVTYSNWSPVEPNFLGNTDPGGWEFYVHIFNPQDPNAARWNNVRDVTESVNRGIFGVAEVVPEPTSAVLLGAGGVALFRRRRMV